MVSILSNIKVGCLENILRQSFLPSTHGNIAARPLLAAALIEPTSAVLYYLRQEEPSEPKYAPQKLREFRVNH